MVHRLECCLNCGLFEIWELRRSATQRSRCAVVEGVGIQCGLVVQSAGMWRMEAYIPWVTRWITIRPAMQLPSMQDDATNARRSRLAG